MKIIFLMAGFVFALVFSGATNLGGGFFNSARAFDICGGQETFNNWYFAVADTDKRKINFGPHKCKNICTEARNNEARKMKWVVVGACETGSIPSNDALSEMVPKWQENQEKMTEMGFEYQALDERIPGELDRWKGLRKEAEAAMLDYETKMPEINQRGAALEARELVLNKEYDSYFSACNRVVEEAQEVANCNARFDRYTAAHGTLGEEFNKLNMELLTLNNTLNRALEASKKLGELIQVLEERKNYLFDEGIIAHVALMGLAPGIQGLASGSQVLPYLDPVIFRQTENLREVCKPFEFVNPIDYEECYLPFMSGVGPYADALFSGKDQ